MENKIKSAGFHNNISDQIHVVENTEQRNKFIETLIVQAIIAFRFVESSINAFSLRDINSYILFNFFTGSELFLKSLILGQTDNAITFENANITIASYDHNLSKLIEEINIEILMKINIDNL